MEARGNGVRIAAVPLPLQQYGTIRPLQGVAAKSGEKKEGAEWGVWLAEEF